MSLTGAAFSAALASSLLAVTAATTLPRRARRVGAGLGTGAAGLLAVVAGGAALAGRSWDAWLPDLLPLAGVRLAIDPLGGLFLAVTGAVAVCAAVYGVGYARPGSDGTGLDSRVTQAMVPLFVAAMVLVTAAASVSTFLVAWELMALTSLLLVVAEHRRRTAVVEAGLWYTVMTHLGLVVILAGLVGFAAAADGETFAQLRAASDEGMSPAVRGAVFVATFVGFASKAGMVPLHVWLPRAHPEAPSHVSALMSAAMVNLGVYGILRVGFDLLGGGPVWWWLLVLATGAVSALYGILQAAVATDLKRLLAYSTCENLGLVLVGVGACGIFAASDARPLAALAMTAALLHVVNHAGFKTLLFLSAGSVVHATGTRDLDALGGLRSPMPATTALFGVGALMASALPLGNGFVSEWLLVQSLIHALPAGGTVSAVTMPLAVAVVALSAGLAIATFVKAFGVGFLARPRTRAAERAHESPATMVVGMGAAAVCCVALALAPGWAASGLSRAVAVAVPGPEAVSASVTLQPAGLPSTVSPLVVAGALLVAMVASVAVLRAAAPAARRARARRRARLWDCGVGPMSARTEYTATSFAEPLQRVFDDVLAPETDLDVTPVTESSYLVDSVTYRARVGDRIEHRLYRPVLAAMAWTGRAARPLANGSVHRYVGYGFYAFTGVLVALAVLR
ncbi:formate hydrogenlyase subunit 3/multisubunit Na+/H+ antiporter MnhD subunit [Actinomadura pelletieri DSM 43383]|uniref:Formate hydrogenlyase subunit 3/multisubunit Na+/H+ antiporter MnhD subunit n=1 Tax=Actinomadura pelletieri DSM 43383 TaxID=1120940 RepID=A0A495QKJ9_9ACTN|nr:proton-conducting transporter membrane subunit [Actinomadura pelletieri]RKS73013.1 formate hydrogenlyase subunit 3/multisubunit Na+/H+ antiporter MnhD subunit [Actinomadura pelletieri DSM 43383]